MSTTSHSGAPQRSLVIPMKDEADRIGTSLRAIADSPLNDLDTELVLVDDGSVDDTGELAARLLKELDLRGEVVRLPTNRGKGAAVAAGVAVSRAPFVAFVDADLSTPPSAVLEVFEVVESGRADVVVTSRVHPDAEIAAQPPQLRRYGGKTFNVLLRGLGLTTMNDTQCGLKAFTADAAAVLFRDLRIEGFAFDVEILERARRAGLRVEERAVLWRHVEASRVRPVRDGLRMAFDVTRLRLRPAPVARPGVGAPSMDDTRFPVMAAQEADHWWFRAKRRLAADALTAASARGPSADLGCGTGAMLATLEEHGFGPVVGTDLALGAVAHCRHAVGHPALLARAEALPFPDEALGCATSLDVIEHLDDDVAGLREYRRVLRPGGVLVLAVPAYEWAWSDHDVALGHRRRYDAPSLRASVEAGGFEVERLDHFHAWLVAPAWLLRRTPLRHLLKGAPEEASFVNPTVNRLLGAITAVERWIGARVRIPWGLSLLVVARRPRTP